MKLIGRALVLVAILAVIAWTLALRPADRPVFTDVSGLWRMRETHSDFGGALRWTWLEIKQDGDRLEILAWEDGDTWKAWGKGRVEGKRALFQWWGADKSWRGLATLRLKDGELMGIFQRLDVHAGEQYCRGGKVASSRLPVAGREAKEGRAGGFDISRSRP
ncbi:MAG TPA: hypothetical protein VFS19_02065 [Planctomycetota bacterium]|nr:hypothetical protein [Planctomycetota bacterium]